MLELNNLSAYYGNVKALDDVSLKIESGKIVSIIGSNGAGKSTLLKSISGLIRKKTGEIKFEGSSILSKSASKMVKKGICHVLEGRQLFAHLTVLDNLDLGAYSCISLKNKAVIQERKESIFKLFPILKERSSQISGTLSGGEQQMLAIGRALMANPKLLLMDEPSLGLAPRIVHDIFKIIKDLNKQGTTILLVEQNANVALGISDYAYVLETGRIILEDTGKNLLLNDEVQKAYLGA